MQLPRTRFAHALFEGRERTRYLLGPVITRRVIRWLSVVTSISMFVLLITGTLVTTTNSAQGRGRSWPLCHRNLLPQFAVLTAISSLPPTPSPPPPLLTPL